MKKFLALVLVLVMVGGGAVVLFMFLSPTKSNEISISFTPDKPKFADIDMITDLKIPTKDEDKNKLAYDLYALANKNDQAVEGRMYYSFCPTDNIAMGMSQKIDLYIFNIKDGDEFFRIDYRVKNSVPLLDTMPWLNNALELVTTERNYYNPKLGKMYYEKVRNADLDKDKNIPIANWEETKSNKIYKEQRSAPYYNATQDKKYEKCDHTILADTIKSAEIKKTEDGVKVKIVLDCVNPITTEKTRPLIIEGANAKNAEYKEITVEFELWANGYYKTYTQSDLWTAKAMGTIDIVSTFDYTDVYVYDKKIYDLSKWADAKEIKEKCANGLPALK